MMGDSHTRLRAAAKSSETDREDDTLRTNLRDVSGEIPPAVDRLLEAGSRFADAARAVREKARAIPTR